MRQIEAVIFDMDGVITDTEDLHARTEHETCEAFGIPAPPKLWEGFKGLREREIFSILLANAGRDDITVDALIEDKVRRYSKAAPDEAELVPGADAFVRACHDRGYRLALATSCLRSVAELTLGTFGLRPYFSVLTTGEDVSKGKPDPEPYALTAQRLELPPEACAVIEDSDNGIRSAKAAGCRVFGITTSFPAPFLKDVGAEIIVDDIGDLARHLPPRQK